MTFKTLPSVRVARVVRTSSKRCIVTFEGDADAITAYVNGETLDKAGSFTLELTRETGATRGAKR